MLTDPAGENIIRPEARVAKAEREKTHVQTSCPVPAEPGTWQAYLIKMLPPLPEHP